MARRRTVVMVQDAALAVVITAMGLGELWVPFESIQGTGSPVVATIGIVLSGVLLVFRRTRPLLLIGVPALWIALTIASGGDILVLFFGQAVPMYLVAYTGVRHCPLRQALAVTGSVLATLLLSDFFIPQMQGPSEVLFHWGAMLAVLGVGLGLRAAEHRAVTAAVRASEVEAASREQALRAAADERARIARELHDILGHSVSVMVVQAGAAAQAVDDDPEFVRRALESIRTTGTQSLDEVRRVVALLRSDDGEAREPQPGFADVPTLIADARAHGTVVEVVERGERPALTPGQELAVYRILQEALTNVRRHAPGSAARVELASTAEAVEVTVDSVGAASSDASGGGNGIVGMRERVHLYGGSLDAGPGVHGGWRVHARIPVAVRAEAR